MQQDNAVNTSSGAIDVGEVLSGIWQRKLMVFLFVTITTGLAVAFVTVAKPKYTATAKVLVENLETPFTKVQQSDRREARIDERDVLSQVQVVTSPDLARQVLLSLDGKMQARFTTLKPQSLIAKLLIVTGFQADPARMKPDQRALAKLNKNSTVYAIPRSKVIVMSYTSSDPSTAARVVNTLAQKYVGATRTAQSVTTDRAQDWLGRQIEVLRKKVVESEGVVEEFRAKAGLLRGATNTLNSQELSELNSQIILAAASKAEARARANSIRDLLATTGTVDGASEVINSVLIQRLREQQVRLRRRRAELSATFLDNHPRIKAVKQELVDLDRQVRSEALKIVNGLEQQAKIAETREASLRTSLNHLKKKASSSGADEVKLRALEREAKANRGLLESFLARYTDAAARVKPESQPGLARVIATAGVPSIPTFPKKGPIVSLAAVAGLTFGLGIAFLLEVMAAAGRMQQIRPVAAPNIANTVGQAIPAGAYLVPPVQTPAAAPSLCELPRSPDHTTARTNAQSAIFDPTSDFAGAIRTLASWVQSQRQTLGVKRVAMVALPEAVLDCATTTIGLARCLADQGIRIVVVEADADTNSIDTVAPLQPSAGLAELVAGTATFSDVIVRDQISSVHYVRSGLTPFAATVGNFPIVLDALDHAYDVVLLNNGATKFPATKDQTGLTACHAAVVLASGAQGAEAVSLCGALTRAGLRAAQYAQIGQPASANGGSVVSGLAASA